MSIYKKCTNLVAKKPAEMPLFSPDATLTESKLIGLLNKAWPGCVQKL